jgi:hypothetical protein
MEYENPVVVTLDNKIIYETVVGGEEDNKAYDYQISGALDKLNARLKNIRLMRPVARTRSESHSDASPSPSPTMSCRCTCPVVGRIVNTA